MRTTLKMLIISAFLISTASSQDYFPLREGNQWIYIMSNGVEMTVKITGFAEINGVRCAVAECLAEGDRGIEFSKEYLAVDTEGLKLYMSQMQGQDVVYNPPIIRFKLPFKQGQIWTSNINPAETTMTEAVGIQDVATNTGKFKCIVIRSKASIPGQSVINYYSDGVGLVRQQIQIGSQTITTSLVAANVKPTEKIGPPPKIVIQQTHCPNCSTLIDSNAKFCPSCGAEIIRQAPIPEVPTTCPYCGAALPEGAKFCSECGKEVIIPSVESVREIIVDVNQEKIYEQYKSTRNKVMLYKPQNWDAVEYKLTEGTDVISIIRPDETAIVVFMTFANKMEINDSVTLAASCLNAFRGKIPDLEGKNVKSTSNKNQTVMDISYTEGDAKGVGHGYFFFTERVGTVYLLLARSDMWQQVSPTLIKIAANIAYAPEGIENVIKQGKALADKKITASQEHIVNPAAMLQQAAKKTGKKMQLIPASPGDKSITLQIPKDWHLEGREQEYFLYDNLKTKNRGMTSGLHTIIFSDITIAGIPNEPYKPPSQAMNLLLEFNHIGSDMEILAELPGEQVNQDIAKAIKAARAEGMQVDCRLINARFKSISSPEQNLRGLFSIHCITIPMSPIWHIVIDGSWAPENEFDEWLPSYLQICKTLQINTQQAQDEQQNQFTLQKQLNRNLQDSIADSNQVFEEYIDSLKNADRSWDYISWMWSQTSLAHGRWVAQNEGAELHQADFWGIESDDISSEGTAFNTAAFTGEKPWTDEQLKLIDTQVELIKYMINN
ncbi:MAG: zinc ribbon domain-containing protein [Sedimentisphaerales bacterium]|nr:zinc ribbon domain-containing protein [Sedimentisphaerales bacterium]